MDNVKSLWLDNQLPIAHFNRVDFAINNDFTTTIPRQFRIELGDFVRFSRKLFFLLFLLLFALFTL